MPRGKKQIAFVQTEAEIQAEFYHQCRLVGILCRLELHTRAGRPDCIIGTKDGNKAAVVVEVKRGATRLDHRQLARYRWLGLDVFTLCHSEEIPRLVARLQKLLPDIPGVTWDTLLKPGDDY